MSARALRRTFGTPFVLTLAAIPACVTTSAPPPSQPTRGHEPGHVNPPKPRAEPPWQEAVNAETPPPSVVENPPRPSTEQQTPTTSSPPRGYREWRVSKSSGACTAMVKVNCPDGAMCNPPPPAKYDCPSFMADNDRIDVIQRTEKAECYVDHGDPKCPPNTTCNPPRPQKVACPQ